MSTDHGDRAEADADADAGAEAVRPGLIGRALPRVHDARMLRGHGRYADDLDDGTALHAAVVRSPVPHGRVTRFDGTAAREGGAALVLGPDEIARHADPLPTVWRLPGQHQRDIEVATRTVRYVGQPLGLVVAASRAAAEDAAERVELSIDPLPPVVGVDAALAPGAPLLYPEAGTNVAGEVRFGDPADEIERAMAAAPHVVTRELTVQRVNAASMEPRGLLAEWIPHTERLTVWSSTQVPHPVRHGLATALRLRADQIQVLVPDLGGAFGSKTTLYVDEALVCLAARLLGGRVAWTEDRTEALTATYQGRGQTATARLALGHDGRFLALDAHVRGDLGAFSTQGGSGPFQITGQSLEGPYKLPLAGATVTCVHTNAAPTGAYRGYGMQESTWIRERLIAEAARELGLDADELRLRNLIAAEEMPYTVRTHMTYDTGDYPATFRAAADAVAEAPRERTGRVRRGVATVPSVEITGYGPTALLEMTGLEASGWESGRIRVNQDGTVTVFAGAVSMGQGIETTLTQIVADRLGVPMSLVAVRLGDTEATPHSEYSSQASRSLVLSGSALLRAGERLRERMDALAAAFLETTPEDVRLEELTFRADKTDRTATWREIAHRGWLGWGRPEHDRIQLEETVDFDPPDVTYAHASHAAAVAVDLDTGAVTVEGYWAVHDSGVLVNPLIAEGQTAGAVAQGLGLALLEEAAYDPVTARPLAASFWDYAIPAPPDVPEIRVSHTETPTPHNPGGFKGLGEGGTLPTAAAVVNAVADAVPEIAARLDRTPLTPYRVWTLLRDAGLADEGQEGTGERS
ncbi:xanthine dehydrogenase family protein molybdopterin-binding subunit [Streptomyces albiaxialis]|uniref:Xanthine dehydrogenase family protein molybdopterin-binding subunit n=1 Tax=Streptomyces albiaxialis TaxID=329523 RepID=A0ABN2WJJ2_9ACTN